MNGVNFAQMCGRVREELAQEHRYAHVVRVARLADRLAQAHGEDRRAARVAGMLHDLARLYSAEKLLEESAARGIPIDAFARLHPVVLHAPLGAELAREQYGIDDERILSAIRSHTLGAPGMSRLDKIVFLADGLEPGRDFAERSRLERLALHDLDAAMRATLRSTIAYLAARGLAVAPATTSAIEYFALTEKEKKTA
ncbi:MAG: bis(5'-nucleosyl)-tetraphosphatase (symmetrical) YqeK [Candidatus Eremiobacteraeota bacterium]|nr:bis(5'-nucleosyl)-tetraphosphatase (symmetrical) YqeK [Candidatus Eremiobacteraeota bacterium]